MLDVTVGICPVDNFQAWHSEFDPFSPFCPMSLKSVLKPYPLSVAPMMDRTDRHFRYFMRQITRRTLLYTEMVTAAAILHGDQDALLGFSPVEKPLVLQVGGDDPQALARCTHIAEQRGYDAINLNVGCPSPRVQTGNFGACLMTQPQRVADCVAAMGQAATLPISVKHRIGVDQCDRYEDMAHFVHLVAEAGCQHFTVHARKAWLQGLSPKENRQIPPLRYDDVHRLKQDFPDLAIEINGGFSTLEQVQTQLQQVDAVMIGREPLTIAPIYLPPSIATCTVQTHVPPAVTTWQRPCVPTLTIGSPKDSSSTKLPVTCSNSLPTNRVAVPGSVPSPNAPVALVRGQTSFAKP